MNTPATPPQLVLRLDGLRPMDEAVIRVFLQHVGTHLSQWVVSNTAQTADLLLHSYPADGGKPSTTPNTRCEAWVAHAHADVPHPAAMVLRRPLQLESFAELLTCVTQQLCAPSRPSALIPLTASAAHHFQAESFAHAPEVDHAADLSHPQLVFKLRRWPGAQLLAQHTQLIRITGWLIAQHISLQQLVRQGGASPQLCLTLLEALHRHGLLDIRMNHTTPATVVAHSPSHAPASAGIIGRLRQRLGI